MVCGFGLAFFVICRVLLDTSAPNPNKVHSLSHLFVCLLFSKRINSEEDYEEIAYLDERLFPLMVLTGEAESAAREHGEPWPEGEEREQMLADCEDDLPQAVADIYNFWRAKRSIGMVRRDAPKVGRNDECPCGSGKKYKFCCGDESGD